MMAHASSAGRRAIWRVIAATADWCKHRNANEDEVGRAEAGAAAAAAAGVVAREEVKAAADVSTAGRKAIGHQTGEFHDQEAEDRLCGKCSVMLRQGVVPPYF